MGPRDYNHLAPVYDQIFHGLLNEGHELIAQVLCGERPLRGRKVLEVGVGSGLTMNYLPRSIQYTGVDINQEMLDRAREKMKRLERIGYSLELMDAETLQFKKESFDFVIAASVLTAVQNPDATMREMIRVTKRGGKIAIVANIRCNNSLYSTLVKGIDPLTKKFLGFRTDLEMKYFEGFEALRLLGKVNVNRVLGIPLSTFLIFEKV